MPGEPSTFYFDVECYIYLMYFNKKSTSLKILYISSQEEIREETNAPTAKILDKMLDIILDSPPTLTAHSYC